MKNVNKMKNLIILIQIILFYSCAGTFPEVSNQNNDYNTIIHKYAGDYFIGVGTGEGATEGVAIIVI